MSRKRFPFIRQYDLKDCGPTCLAMISKYYGLTMSISKIREVAGTDLLGTNIKGLLEASEQLGFDARGVKVTDTSAITEIPLPAIAHIITEEGVMHYVVVYKIKRDKIFIADPDKGLITYNIEDFDDLWTGVLVLLQPGKYFKKEKGSKGALSQFLSLLKPQLNLLVPLFFASIFLNLFGFIGVFYFQLLIDDIVPNQSLNTLHIISVGMIVLYVFKVLLSYFRTHLILYFSRRIDIQLMLGYYRHVIKLPLNFFETRKVGEIISRFSDAGRVHEVLSTTAITLVIDILMILFGTCILLTKNLSLFLVTLLLVPFYVIIVFVFRKSYEVLNRKVMESGANLNSYMIESLSGMGTIKSYNAEKEVFFQVEKRFIKFLGYGFRLGKLDNLQSSIRMILELIGGVVILWVGATQVLKGNMTIGELITFNALLIYFLDPIENLIDLQPKMQSAIVAAERLNEIFDLDLEEDENEHRKVSPTYLSGNIECRNVSFRYGTRGNVLNNLSFSIEQGNQIAFVGESGSGKTTISKLLMNYYTPQQGDIFYDDYHIKEINRTALRERIAYVSQESFFFSGTIYDNLCFGVEHQISLDVVIQATQKACAHNFISELPLRYETVLEENGSNLSGGQKQRLAIARALLKNPDILILDEATSNLDSTTEKHITDMLKELGSEGVTVIMIAHRLSTIQHADQIFVMNQGSIIEGGSHKELLSNKGEYYRLWKNQTVHTEYIEELFHMMPGGQHE
ncbi:peptidase domain-containing ABC transporter [Bacillus hominis]|uniref:Peptidase domain-containing ABC transporter n=1 Tax=Bacillus hominis TaxID=2817478 RepID=A0ABT7RFY7_9BACI|nr:peptidase domain-containing ABC transporter [Bacillus hominis]MDM5191437.1 peptidase domain-containing ABC transporter [Bacillus hominis]MDM5441864.1 peptidase domain-containing ABC transporter [Bacillus hominis]